MIGYKAVRLVRHLVPFSTNLYASCYARGRFCKKYICGTIVKAVDCTDGVYIFDTEHHAREFIEFHNNYVSNLCILKVRIIGKSKKPHCISMLQGENALYDFWNGTGKFTTTSIPKGTLICKSIEILEKV